MTKKLAAKSPHARRHVTKSSDNIFADLGFEPKLAARLLAESNAIREQKLTLRRELADNIAGWIKDNNLKQQDAAEILMVSRPRVSDIVRSQIGKFSIDTLIEMVARTGKQVRIKVA